MRTGHVAQCGMCRAVGSSPSAEVKSVMRMGNLQCGEALVAAEKNGIGRCRMSLLRPSLPFCSVPLLAG